MAKRPNPSTTARFAAALLGCVGASSAAGQGQTVDRGTADLGPNSTSQRVVDPGIAQFSPEGALTDRFAGQSQARLIDLYHRPDIERRYVYRSPGLTALYNESSYLTQDATGLIGINGTNGGNGRGVPIVSADVVYVLSPDLLREPTPEPLPPLPGQVDRQLQPTPMHGQGAAHGYTAPAGATAGNQLNTQIDGQLVPGQPNIVDIEAINNRYRGAQRDPRLVERARQWREEREAAERAAREAEAGEPPSGGDEAEADEDASSETQTGAGSNDAPTPSGDED